jgi:hypothetical protein
MAPGEETPGNWELYRYSKDNKDAIAKLALATVSSSTFQQYQQNQVEKDKAKDERIKALEDELANRKRTIAAQWFAIVLALVGVAGSIVTGLVLAGLTKGVGG